MASLIKSHEANTAVSKYSKITILFRFVEVLFFLIMIISLFPRQFPFSFKPLAEYIRRISLTIISPKFVFVLGNAIVVVLFFIPGKFSANKKGEKSPDLYEQYVEKCNENDQIICSKEEKQINKMCRSYSENILETARNRLPRRELKRSMTEGCRNMSSEEFRDTVEAFIARRQRFLREEEEISSAHVVSSFET